MIQPEYLVRMLPSKPSSTGHCEADDEQHALASLFTVGGVLAAFLVVMLQLGGADIGLLEAAVCFFGALVVVASGEFLLRLAGLSASPARAPAAVVMGTTVTSLVVLAGVLVTGFQAGPIFLGWGVIVAALLIATHHRISWRGRSRDFMDCAVVAVLAVLVAFWCRHAAAAIPEMKANGVLPLWIDYYIHGATIAQFSSSLAVDRGAIDLVAQSLPLYHYAGFMIAAVVGGIADLPGLGLAGAVLLPVGLLVAALGSYALAATLAGPLAGVIAIAFLALLPDASFYGLANGIFGFYWLLFTAPGSGYALGAAAVALVLANEWLNNRNRRALALAVVLVAAIFQLRALFLPMLLLAFTAMLACETTLVRRHPRAFIWLAFGGSGLALALLLAVPPLRYFWLEHSAVVRFLEFVHDQANAPTAYDGLYARHIASVGRGAAMAFGTALLLPAMLGGLVLLYPVALAAWIKRAGWQVIDLFPLLLLVAFVAVVVLAPSAPNGDATEYQHRPFVLVYQVVAIWTAVYLCRLAFDKTVTENSARALPALMVVAATSILIGWLTGLEPGQPRFAWGKDFFRVSITPGIVEAAEHVRNAAGRGDVVAVVPLDPKATLIDRAIEFVSLTDIPSYLARPGIQMLHGAQHREVATERLARMAEVEAASDRLTAFTLLQRMGVTWYVRIGGEGPRFDPDRSHAAFATGNVTVYRIEPGKPAG